MKRKILLWFIFSVNICVMHIYAFDKGFTLGLKANFTGSYTDPHISNADKNYLGAQFMHGMAGFIMTGEAELTYIFDAERYFNRKPNNAFGGLGLAFNIGVGQGFSGQISGQYNDLVKKNIEVYCRVYMKPTVSFGTALKILFLQNRLTGSFGIGGNILADPQPVYELYTNLDDEELKLLHNEGKGPDFYPETGTLYIPRTMMKKMNPLGLVLRGALEYNQPVISRMDITIGAHVSYTIYKPIYTALPKKIAKAAIENGKLRGIDVNFERDKLRSFYMNSLNFGLSLGLLFKV
ncbi:hypothetical protein [Treponema pedis]|uniref:hypothetical protein n=1 Tax=Treponema pedis TaxID=409322 RepID=UPI003133FF47